MPSWVENLAVRSNGQILVTLSSAAEVFLIDPADPSKAALIHRFSDVTGMSGIIEVEHDKFYVVGGNFDLKTFVNQSGSYKLWEVDMTDYGRDSKAIVTEVIRLDKIGMPNGLELLSKTEKVILAADCEAGAVFKIDLVNGSHETAVEVDEMKNPDQPFIPIAINGISVHKGYLYWTNTSKALFCRVEVSEDGTAAGEVEIIKQGLIGDDFCFDMDDNAWIARNPFNTIAVVKAAGDAVTVAGQLDRLEIAGVTACQFDRKPGNEHMLYVVTNGGLGGPVNGTQVEGGKVAVIDTSLFKA
ncbi:putative six-bladed beta-propeller -like protein [Phaeoacremonium minimum UCRPA7]|uniref:Putative six-bladed beta-propeller-like protein n=1 Tax=Phaeoacremonium minimum (strain UCR-PA7) TaxID=1286976 RepID=R8B8J4_PHAM7|nr:putative six-bladed beta-propeller -like protein [Phaeoacremonium minimum UCRPA7]EON95621.1 putative six-bladed beta-propeller -like protein [Phaeoacremonium minimum UCRPA7]